MVASSVCYDSTLRCYGSTCKGRENSNFFKNDKIVISTENPEFF